MVAVIEQAILQPRSKDLRNVTLTNISAAGPLMHVLSDNKTLIFSLNTRIYLSTNYGSSFVSGDLLADATWDIRGFIETPGGEMLVSLHKNNSLGPAGAWADTAGYVLRSTGWNPATGHATSWATVLTTSGPGCYCRGLWGFNQWGVAPTWSPDAGAIFISEYGPQTTTAATPAQSAHSVWRSLDDGATWTVVFSLLDHYNGTTQQVHLHGLCYDPWDARLYVTHGDGGGSPAGIGTVFYSDNPTATSPTFTEMTEWHETNGFDQVTNVTAFEAGIILLPDGGPQGAKLLPRRGHRRLGTHVQTAQRRRAAAPFIGATVTRRGYQQDPQPTSPIWMCFVEPAGDTGIPTIWVSPDGRSVREAYRHTAIGEINFVHGPDVNGKVVANITVSGVTYLLTADYIPPPVAEMGVATPAESMLSSLLNGTAVRTSFSRWLSGTTIGAPTSGTMLLVAMPLQAGDVITNLSFCTSTTALTMGSNADGHLWFALFDPSGDLAGQTADQGGAATWAASTVKTLALASQYTAPTTGVYYAAVMVNSGTGGSPAVPTLRGMSLGTASLSAAFAGMKVLCGTNGSALTATAPGGPITVAAGATAPFCVAS